MVVVNIGATVLALVLVLIPFFKVFNLQGEMKRLSTMLMRVQQAQSAPAPAAPHAPAPPRASAGDRALRVQIADLAARLDELEEKETPGAERDLDLRIRKTLKEELARYDVDRKLAEIRGPADRPSRGREAGEDAGHDPESAGSHEEPTLSKPELATLLRAIVRAFAERNRAPDGADYVQASLADVAEFANSPHDLETLRAIVRRQVNFAFSGTNIPTLKDGNFLSMHVPRDEPCMVQARMDTYFLLKGVLSERSRG